MGRKHKVIPETTISRILELRRSGRSLMSIGDELHVVPAKVQSICAEHGFSVRPKYKPRLNHRRRFDGFITTGYLPKYVKDKFKSLYSKKNIITTAVLDDNNVNPFVRTYSKPLGLK